MERVAGIGGVVHRPVRYSYCAWHGVLGRAHAEAPAIAATPRHGRCAVYQTRDEHHPDSATSRHGAAATPASRTAWWSCAGASAWQPARKRVRFRRRTAAAVPRRQGAARGFRKVTRWPPPRRPGGRISLEPTASPPIFFIASALFSATTVAALALGLWAPTSCAWSRRRRAGGVVGPLAASPTGRPPVLLAASTAPPGARGR